MVKSGIYRFFWRTLLYFLHRIFPAEREKAKPVRNLQSHNGLAVIAKRKIVIMSMLLLLFIDEILHASISGILEGP